METVMPEKSTNEKIFDKLDTLSGSVFAIEGDVRVIKNEMTHKVGEIEMRDYVDGKLNSNQKPSKPPRDTMRINIIGLKPFAKWLIAAILAGALGGGGYVSGRNAVEKEVPAQADKGDK